MICFISFREVPVDDYRFYILDLNETLTGPSTRLDFPDDNAAIKYAEKMVGGHFVELWQGERRIGRFATIERRKRSRSTV
jgi:hypothetical protein